MLRQPETNCKQLQHPIPLGGTSPGFRRNRFPHDAGNGIAGMMDHPHQLYAVEFTEADQARLAGFSCGDESWSRHVTEWIRGSEVLDSIKRWGTRVWLFEMEQGEVVGFGSVGTSVWQWQPPGGPKTTVVLIPMLGIDIRYQGYPPEPEWRYSRQIMAHLVFEGERPCAVIRRLIGLVQGRFTYFDTIRCRGRLYGDAAWHLPVALVRVPLVCAKREHRRLSLRESTAAAERKATVVFTPILTGRGRADRGHGSP